MFHLLVLSAVALLAIPREPVDTAFAGRPGAFVLIDTASGETFRNDAGACAEKLAPCSTFKIWNSAIGLELGLVTDPDAPFWKWDGEKRFLDAWSADQTLRSAMAVSCVPAYQALARKIGPERMQAWVDRLDYGDRNLAAGVDIFWLPDAGRRTLLISPDEQAAAIARLATGKTPLSAPTLASLKSIMRLRETPRGTLYGKTGSALGGKDGAGAYGWFVGYVESGGRTHAFACLLKGAGAMGKDARAATEKILVALQWL